MAFAHDLEWRVEWAMEHESLAIRCGLPSGIDRIGHRVEQIGETRPGRRADDVHRIVDAVGQHGGRDVGLDQITLADRNNAGAGSQIWAVRGELGEKHLILTIDLVHLEW